MGLCGRKKIANPIPLHRVAVVRPFVEFLADIGAPVERGFQRAGLPYSALENLDNYIPSHRFWEFLVEMACSEGILDLGFRVGERFGANSPDPRTTDLLLKSPTLYTGLLKASELTNRTISNCQLGILQPRGCRYSYFYHRPSCDADNAAIEQIGWFGVMALLGMVRVYTGRQWQPAEIGVMTHHTPGRYIRAHFPHTRIRLSQAYSYITLENSLLSQQPVHDEAAIPMVSALHYDAVPVDFADTLEQVLLSYSQESDLNIELAAGLCNTSKRTLQRRLSEAGTHYNEVLGHARFRVASRLLQDPALKVTDIAKRLGYSDVSHFSRAFRRIAGINPRAYRRQFTH